jgi:heptosyltransferase-3
MNIQKIRRSITKNIFSVFVSNQQKTYENIDRNSIKKILIIRPNHRLGNQILMTALMCEIEKEFPNAEMSYLGKGNLSIALFKNFQSLNSFVLLPKKHFKQLLQYLSVWVSMFFKKYDLVINVNAHSSSGKTLTSISNSKYKILNNEKANNKLNCQEMHLATQPIEILRKSFGYNADETYPCLDLKHPTVPKHRLDWFTKKMERMDKPVIFLFTNATGDKDYNQEFWQELYTQLKLQLPNHHIVEMLPIENRSKFNFEIDYFYSKSMDEMCQVLNHGAICISGDCGVMHLAVASRIPTLGLFKFDNMDKYKPYGNMNSVIDTRVTSVNEIVHEVSKMMAVRTI